MRYFLSQPELDTKALVELSIEGDASSQMKLYDRYYKAMYNTAVRIVKDSYEAEDVMQESFLNAFTKLHTFRGEVAFGAWLKRIVINNSIYAYRKRNRNAKVPMEDMMYKVKDDDGVAEEDREFTNVKAQQVLQTMKTLKDNYRVSLTLHLIEGYDYEEVSEIMNISYANCRTMISRAKESLRKKMMAS